MFFQLLIESLLNIGGEHSILVHALFSILVLLKVAIDCRKLSEGIAIHILPVIFFPLLYLLLWLLVWPGALVLAMKGRKLEDTLAARMVRRNKRSCRSIGSQSGISKPLR